MSWSTVALNYAAHNPAALQPRHLEADLRARASAADEDAGAAFSEECRQLIAIVIEAQGSEWRRWSSDATQRFQGRLAGSFHTIHHPTRPTNQMMPTAKTNGLKGHSNWWDESASNIRTSPIAMRPSETITCMRVTAAPRTQASPRYEPAWN